MRKKTHEEFIEGMKIKNPKIEILGEYTNNKIKIKCKCLVDNYIWDVRPDDLLKGHGCPKCGGTLKKTHEEFIEEMKIKNPDIKILGKYINARTKIQCKCLIDRNIWDAKPNDLLKGHGCPKCGGVLRRTTKEFIEEMKIKNPNIEILGKYINNKTKIKCRCLIDGCIWETVPKSILSGCGCPKCKSSKGEAIIENYCKNNYLKYISQYKTDKCIYKRSLPFDFALFNNKKIIAIVEFQGKQHYEPVDFAGKGEEWAKTQFRIIQKKDQIKREYCFCNNIPLIEIPYWIEDAEVYLEEQINRINKPIQLSFM